VVRAGPRGGLRAVGREAGARRLGWGDKKAKPPFPLMRGKRGLCWDIGPGGDLLSRAETAEYHRRSELSLPCSEWERVGRSRHGRRGTCDRRREGAYIGGWMLTACFGAMRGNDSAVPALYGVGTKMLWFQVVLGTVGYRGRLYGLRFVSIASVRARMRAARRGNASLDRTSELVGSARRRASTSSLSTGSSSRVLRGSKLPRESLSRGRLPA
jgi:hypothetical protein